MTKRATVYARCSTERQDQSIADQLKAVKMYAAENAYEIDDDIFIDEGFTGTDSVNRPAFMRMMNLIEAGRANFRFILCYDTTRWSRSTNPNEPRGWEFVCNRHDIKVVYTNESFGNDNTLPNDVSKGIKQAMASEDSRKLSKVVTRGMKSRAEKGFRLSHAPYGYARAEADPEGNIVQELPLGRRIGTIGNHAVLVLGDARQVEVVKSIYRMYLNGLGVKKIAWKLNSDKTPSARGRHWSDSTVRGILTNEVYMGTQIFGKNKRGPISLADNTWQDTESVPYRHDRRNWIIKPNNHPVIIDQATFEKVQKTLEEKPGFRGSRFGRPYGSQYLLYGLLICGKCGNTCVGRSHGGKNRKEPLHEYLCTTHLVFGSSVCDASAFMRERPDQFVTDKISRDLKNPDFRELVKEKLRAKLTSELSASRDHKNIKRDIDTCERSIKTLLTRIGDEQYNNWEILNKYLAERREELERLTAELGQCEDSKQETNSIEQVINDLDSRFLEAADYLSDKTPEDEELNEIRKKIIRQFLHRGVVSSDRCQITFYFYKTPRLDLGSSFPFQNNRTQPPSASDHWNGTHSPLCLIDNPEDYNVEILRLKENVIVEDGETWYTYHAYAQLKSISYGLAKSKAGRGLLAKKYFYDIPYVHDKEPEETIEEDGELWYNYAAYAKLKNVCKGTVSSEVARGGLEKKYFDGKPYVRKTEIEDTVVENGQTWYRYSAFAALKNLKYDTVQKEASEGRLERKLFSGVPYVLYVERGDTIVENGLTWYSYQAYAQLTNTSYAKVEGRARRGLLERKYFYRKPYVRDKTKNPEGLEGMK